MGEGVGHWEYLSTVWVGDRCYAEHTQAILLPSATPPFCWHGRVGRGEERLMGMYQTQQG